MSDVVRLSIVYETQQAASRLNSLNGQLGATHTSTRKLGVAAVGLAQAFSTGGASAAGLTSKLATLGGKAGAVGVILSVAAGVVLLWKRTADKARDATFAFADQLRDTKRAVDDLLRSDLRSPLQTQIENITDAITKLDRVIAAQQGNIFQRLFGGMTLGEVLGNIKRFVVGGTDPKTAKARANEQAQLDRLQPENLAGSLSMRAFNESNRISQFNVLTRGLISDDAVDKVKVLADELKALLEILPPESEQVQSVAKSFREAEDTARRLVRAESLMQNGLGEMADALEDFVVTGTLAFTDFLNNILRLLYRDFTGELIHGLVRSAYGGRPSSIPGGGGGGTQVLGDPTGGAGITASVQQAPVNFNISTMDAQGVAQFINTHGAAIAAEVTRQAKGSASLRRAFRRG